MGTHPIFESDFDCLTEPFKMKKLADLTLEEVQQELEKRGLSVAGEDQELGQLLTELSRQSNVEEKAKQRLSDWLEDNDHDPDDFVFEEITEEPETENQVYEEKEEIEDKEDTEAKESPDEEET